MVSKDCSAEKSKLYVSLEILWSACWPDNGPGEDTTWYSTICSSKITCLLSAINKLFEPLTFSIQTLYRHASVFGGSVPEPTADSLIYRY